MNQDRADNNGECSSDDDIQYLPQEGGVDVNCAPAPLYKPEKDPASLNSTIGVANIAEGMSASEYCKVEIKSDITEHPCNISLEGDNSRAMKSMGLPGNFANRQGEDFEQQDYKMDQNLPPSCFGATSYQEQQTVRKGQKETFYCEYCLIELNSRDTLYSHTKGTKHIRKKEQHQQEVRRGANRGYRVQEKDVRQIANPLALQKKVPVRLNEKLRETTTVIVGLDFVHEIIACSNAEVEPYYECTLCGQQGEANAMYQHLQGKPHRANFLRKRYPDNPKYIAGTLNQGFLEQELERLNLRENNDLNKINTVYSDEKFPWTAGKAPWSVEQGGTGIVPTGARNKVGLVSQNLPKQGFGTGSMDSKDGVKDDKSLKDFNPSKLDYKLDSDYDKKHACALVQKISEKIKDYNIEHENMDPFQMEMLHNQVDAIMEVLSLTNAGGETNNAMKKAKTNASPVEENPIKRELSPRSYSNYNGNSLARERDYDRNNRNPSSWYDSNGSRDGRDGSRGRDNMEHEGRVRYGYRDDNHSSRMDYERRY